MLFSFIQWMLLQILSVVYVMIMTARRSKLDLNNEGITTEGSSCLIEIINSLLRRRNDQKKMVEQD